MNKFFNSEGSVMLFLGKMADLLWLNILTMLCCIPIITAGASITAMYSVTIKLVKKEEGYITRDFFKSFKTNFKQATLLWLIVLVVLVLFYGDYRILNYSSIEFPKILMVLLSAVFILCYFTYTYLFPLLSRYDNTIINIIRNSFLLSISNLPRTILIIVIQFIPIVALYFSQMVVPLILMFGMSFTAYLSSLLFVGIFKKLEGGKESAENEEIKGEIDDNKNEIQ